MFFNWVFVHLGNALFL
jgi:hypothetical protein